MQKQTEAPFLREAGPARRGTLRGASSEGTVVPRGADLGRLRTGLEHPTLTCPSWVGLAPGARCQLP